MIARDERWWDRELWDPEHRRSGSGPLRCLLAEDDCGPARLRAVLGEARLVPMTGSPAACCIRELMATDPAADAAVWADLLSRDLVSEVRPRRGRSTTRCCTCSPTAGGRGRGWSTRCGSGWSTCRRRSRAGGTRAPWTWSSRSRTTCCRERGALAAARARPGRRGERATCERTAAAADVALPVQALGAAYLGGTGLGTLAAAGLAAQARPGAIAALSAAMSWDPAPWCPTTF